MNDAALFDATVPVFRHYLGRIEALLSDSTSEREAPLRQRLAPDAFSAAEHLDTAIEFALRAVFPLLGRTVPTPEDRVLDRNGLLGLAGEVRALLAPVSAQDFEGAAGRRIEHVAGTAGLHQDATTFVTLSALPNFFFHLAMAFALLRGAGVEIGKADFDGQHVYAKGFAF